MRPFEFPKPEGLPRVDQFHDIWRLFDDLAGELLTPGKEQRDHLTIEVHEDRNVQRRQAAPIEHRASGFSLQKR